MTAIERIREQVQWIREHHTVLLHKRHPMLPGGGTIESICASCGGAWPCPILKLAEDKLKLVGALDETTGSLRSAGYEHVCANNERVIAECASEKA